MGRVKSELYDFYEFDSNEYPGFEWDYSTVCNHEWLDTGMRRTYCRKCNIRADRNAMTGEITILPEEVK